MPRWKNMAQINGIDYQMNTDGIKEIAPILCNPTEIREVFINIINNALDAMPDGGSLSFKTWSSKDTVFVSITDTGKGMTEDVMKNIFDPFFTTRRPEGTGLGMSIAYSTIKSHGGKIEVESEVGKGSTVTLQFPVATETAGPIITPGPEQEIKGRNLSILVVDDVEAICSILDNTLSRQGHKVKTVDNGADAIEIIKKESFDLVLCDLAMPNVSGYDVIKALHKLEMTPKIGIITGWDVELMPVEDGELKVDFILKKPFDFSKLTKYINDVVFSTE
jgi:CheY-like chemotaxis protein